MLVIHGVYTCHLLNKISWKLWEGIPVKHHRSVCTTVLCIKHYMSNNSVHKIVLEHHVVDEIIHY
jgi:hypothetical protein